MLLPQDRLSSPTAWTRASASTAATTVPSTGTSQTQRVAARSTPFSVLAEPRALDQRVPPRPPEQPLAHALHLRLLRLLLELLAALLPGPLSSLPPGQQHARLGLLTVTQRALAVEATVPPAILIPGLPTPLGATTTRSASSLNATKMTHLPEAQARTSLRTDEAAPSAARNRQCSLHTVSWLP